MRASLFGKKIIFYIAIIIVWQAIDSADIWPDNIFPSPIEVGEDLIYGISDGSLFYGICLLYTSPSPRDRSLSRMPSSA